MDESQVFCKNHPNRLTGLRCNRCGSPICVSCSVLTPVGYRCKQCVREQQKVFETAFWYDFPIAFALAAVICGAGSILSYAIGFLGLIAAAFVGSIAARVIQAAVRHRRSRYLWLVAAVGGVMGCLPAILPTAIFLFGSSILNSPTGLLGALMAFIWPAGYLVIAVGAMAASIRGLRL